MHQFQYDQLIHESESPNLNYQDRARITDMTGKSASSWISPSYSNSGRLAYTPYHFSLLLRRALGVTFFSKDQPTNCARKFATGRRCDKLLEPNMFHASDGCKVMRHRTGSQDNQASRIFSGTGKSWWAYRTGQQTCTSRIGTHHEPWPYTSPWWLRTTMTAGRRT